MKIEPQLIYNYYKNTDKLSDNEIFKILDYHFTDVANTFKFIKKFSLIFPKIKITYETYLDFLAYLLFLIEEKSNQKNNSLLKEEELLKKKNGPLKKKNTKEQDNSEGENKPLFNNIYPSEDENPNYSDEKENPNPNYSDEKENPNYSDEKEKIPSNDQVLSNIKSTINKFS